MFRGSDDMKLKLPPYQNINKNINKTLTKLHNQTITKKI